MNTAPLLTIMGVVLVLVLVLFLVGMPWRGKQWRLRGLDEGNAARVGRLGEIKTVAATRLILSSSDYIDINDITITTPGARRKSTM